MKILIIGASAAGITAATEIRKVNKEVDIDILSDESFLPYYRPFLTTYIGDKSVENKKNFFLKDANFYKEQNVNIFLNEKAVKIDFDSKNVITQNNNIYTYDKLILSYGSNSFVPPFYQLNKKNFFTIRRLNDAINVFNFVNNIQKVTIIGGGLLGLEAAEELNSVGIKTTIIELSERILPRQLDMEASLILQKKIKDKNIDLILGKNIERFEGEENITHIIFKDGTQIETDMIILSIGVKIDLLLIQNSKLSTNRGIIVNEKMETSIPDVYAAGDVAEFNGKSISLWMPAVNQGKVAGMNAIGGNENFKEEEYPATLNAFDCKIFSIGNISGDETLSYNDLNKSVYRKLIFKDNQLIGGIFINSMELSMKLKNGINNKLTKESALELLK